MTGEQKPREWWIKGNNVVSPFCDNPVHVVEYCALEQAQDEIHKLQDKLAVAYAKLILTENLVGKIKWMSETKRGHDSIIFVIADFKKRHEEEK